MYDTIYAELDCPFCGRQYRHTPLTWEQARSECQEHKEREQQYMQRSENPLDELLRRTQAFRARSSGFVLREGEHEGEATQAWIDQLDFPENIERWRTRKELGLAEIQTKAFESIMNTYFVGDEIPAHWGHYYVQEIFACQGCSQSEKPGYVKVWIEIENRRIKAVLTRSPESGETGKP